ncbi:MAG TPA: hypothetical protein VFS24_11685 [Steroidobacteraceae bacterium]|nr:hypothetical protein [Steroidobacteraceae bacterium]
MNINIPNVWAAPQGWQCPMCRRVYSPTQPMCMYCPEDAAKGPTARPGCGCLPGAELTCPSSGCPRKPFPVTTTTTVSAEASRNG